MLCPTRSLNKSSAQAANRSLVPEVFASTPRTAQPRLGGLLVALVMGAGLLGGCSESETRASVEQLSTKVQETGQHLASAVESAQQAEMGAATENLQSAATSGKEAFEELTTLMDKTAAAVKELVPEPPAQP